MKKIYLHVILIILTGCSWIQEKRNQQVFESEEYKREEALAYSHLLDDIRSSSAKENRNNREFLFGLRTDTLSELEVEKGEEYLFGKLKARRLKVNDINKLNNLKVLTDPKNLPENELEEQDSLYWAYRKDHLVATEVFSLSRIAFNETYSKGVLSYWYNCGSLCGEGCTLYIKKVDGRWVIDSKVGCIAS